MGFKNQIALEIEAMLESFEKEICLHRDCYGMCYPILSLKDEEAIMNCMDSHNFLDLWKS